MILALEYDNLKREATESLSSLYNSFLKRVDYTAEKEKKGWAIEWKKYREGEEMELNTIIEGMPEWMQYTFQHFNNIHGFTREIEKAFIMHGEEIKQSYREGMEHGKYYKEKQQLAENKWGYVLPYSGITDSSKIKQTPHISEVIKKTLSLIEQPNQI